MRLSRILFVSCSELSCCRERRTRKKKNVTRSERNARDGLRVATVLHFRDELHKPRALVSHPSAVSILPLFLVLALLLLPFSLSLSLVLLRSSPLLLGNQSTGKLLYPFSDGFPGLPSPLAATITTTRCRSCPGGRCRFAPRRHFCSAPNDVSTCTKPPHSLSRSIF